MADDKVITTSESSPVASAAADGHKRKHEDLELNNAPEQVTESEAISDRGSLDNVPQEVGNGGVDESETKRPRLEINGDNLGEADGLVSQNGYKEEMKEDQPEEKETEVPASEDNNGQSAEGQESFEEPLQTINEEKDPNDNDIEKTDGITDNEKSDDGNADELSEPNAEVEEPSELPREGDVPVHSSEGQAGSDSQILSRKMEVPNDKVGVLIGKGGDTIKSLQDNSGAKIQIERDADANPRSATRGCELVGTLQSIDKAEKLIKDVIAEADAGGSPSLVARGFSTVEAASGGEQLEIQVPHEKVGLIIGKGGETIRNLQTKSRAHIQLLQPNPSDGDQPRERTVRMTGTKKQIEIAKEMIKDAIHQIWLYLSLPVRLAFLVYQ